MDDRDGEGADLVWDEPNQAQASDLAVEVNLFALAGDFFIGSQIEKLLGIIFLKENFSWFRATKDKL